MGGLLPNMAKLRAGLRRGQDAVERLLIIANGPLLVNAALQLLECHDALKKVKGGHAILDVLTRRGMAPVLPRETSSEMPTPGTRTSEGCWPELGRKVSWTSSGTHGSANGVECPMVLWPTSQRRLLAKIVSNSGTCRPSAMVATINMSAPGHEFKSMPKRSQRSSGNRVSFANLDA